MLRSVVARKKAAAKVNHRAGLARSQPASPTKIEPGRRSSTLPLDTPALEDRACKTHSMSHRAAMSPTSNLRATILGNSKEPMTEDHPPSSRPRKANGTRTTVRSHSASRARWIPRATFALLARGTLAGLKDANLLPSTGGGDCPAGGAAA